MLLHLSNYTLKICLYGGLLKLWQLFKTCFEVPWWDFSQRGFLCSGVLAHLSWATCSCDLCHARKTWCWFESPGSWTWVGGYKSVSIFRKLSRSHGAKKKFEREEGRQTRPYSCILLLQKRPDPFFFRKLARTLNAQSFQYRIWWSIWFGLTEENIFLLDWYFSFPHGSDWKFYKMGNKLLDIVTKNWSMIQFCERPRQLLEELFKERLTSPKVIYFQCDF